MKHTLELLISLSCINQENKYELFSDTNYHKFHWVKWGRFSESGQAPLNG